MKLKTVFNRTWESKYATPATELYELFVVIKPSISKLKISNGKNTNKNSHFIVIFTGCSFAYCIFIGIFTVRLYLYWYFYRLFSFRLLLPPATGTNVYDVEATVFVNTINDEHTKSLITTTMAVMIQQRNYRHGRCRLVSNRVHRPCQ